MALCDINNNTIAIFQCAKPGEAGASLNVFRDGRAGFFGKPGLITAIKYYKANRGNGTLPLSVKRIPADTDK